MLIKGDKREQINSLQFYLDQDVIVPDAEQVISVIVNARITSIEALSGEAKVSYKVTYKVVYRSSQELEAMEDSYDHYAVVKSPSINPKSHIDLSVAVIATEHVGANNLKIRSTLEIKGYTIVAQNFETPDIPEGIYTKNSQMVIESIEPIKESEIIASADFDIKEGIDKILTYDTQIVVNSVATATEVCHVKGDCYTYIIYLAGGNLNSRCLAVPFDIEILAQGVKEGSESYCVGRSNSTTLSLNSDSDSSSLKIEAVVGISGFNIAKHEMDVLCDAYSKSKELDVVYSTANVEDNACLIGVNEKLSGSVRLAEGSDRIRSVLCVCPPSIGAINVANNAELTVEGIVSVPVVYLDENEGIAEIVAELPYHFVLSRDFPCDSSLSARATVTEVSARARHNDEIEISGALSIEVYGSSSREIKYISSVSEIGDKQQNECAISLYIVQPSETLWDVAKALMSDEETLLELNPDLSLPLVGGEKVLMYREL